MKHDKVLEYIRKNTNIDDTVIVHQDLYLGNRNFSTRSGLYCYWIDGHIYNIEMGDYKFKASTAIKIMRLL